MDKFVCGTCKVTYNSFETFSSHKRVCQKANASNDTTANALNSCVVSFQFVDAVGKSTPYISHVNVLRIRLGNVRTAYLCLIICKDRFGH